MRVFLTGARGLIGSRLAERLVGQGDHVMAVSRRVDPSRESSLDWIEGDVSQAGPWQDRLDGADAVVHLAGEPIAARRWSAQQKERIRASRVESTARIGEAIARAQVRPRTLVCASGCGYYGSRGEEDLDESAPPGEDFLARLCQEWETQAFAAGCDRTVCLRFGVVLSHRGGAMKRLLPAFKLFLGGPLGRANAYFPWIHENDAVGLILHGLAGRLAGPVNAVAPDLVRMRDFARALGKALSRPSAVPVPEIALRLVLGELGETLTPGQKVLPRAALASGYCFVFESLPAALAAVVSSEKASDRGPGP